MVYLRKLNISAFTPVVGATEYWFCLLLKVVRTVVELRILLFYLQEPLDADHRVIISRNIFLLYLHAGLLLN